jgi:hypothetical protein
MAHAAGVPCREALRETPNVMPGTLCFILANIDEEHTAPSTAYAEQALADGHFTFPEVRIVASRIARGIYSFNAGHVFDMNAVDPDSLSQGMMTGRMIVAEHVSYLRKYVPGYEDCELVSTAPLMGVRESRRIVGEYELTWGDFADGRQFPDQIGVFNKEVDIHAYGPDAEHQEQIRRMQETKVGKLPPGTCYGLPYGILVPKGWKNLWVPGRSVSVDIMVHASCRVMPACSMMGEAAGAAAVQSIRSGQTADRLDTRILVEQLRAQGAILPQKELSQEMTRGRGADTPSNPLCPVEEK